MNNLIIYAQFESTTTYSSTLFKLEPDTLTFLGDEVLTYAKPPKTGVRGGTLHIVLSTQQEYYTVRRDLCEQGDTSTTWRNVMQRLGW